MRGINSTDKRRVRQALHAEADGRCAYCNRPTSLRSGTVDHYMPQALGGTNARPNLRWSCLGCNGAKADMHPDEWEVRKPEPYVEQPTRYAVRCELLQRIAQRWRTACRSTTG